MGVTKDGDLLFSCECDELRGKVIRNVYRVDFTPENLEKIYLKARQFRTLMGYEVLTRDQFYGFFVKPAPYKDIPYESKGLCARVDDFVGIFWLTDINFLHPPHDASIHYTFFDRNTWGRIELCRKAIEYVFDTYGFNRLWTKVPVYTKYTLKFVERIGFRREGRIQSNALYKGKLFDTNLYALTKDEIPNRWEELDGYKRGKWTGLSSRDRQSIESGEPTKV
jgi:RimJ/RimL family protein N-acetyltransferase